MTRVSVATLCLFLFAFLLMLFLWVEAQQSAHFFQRMLACVGTVVVATALAVCLPMSFRSAMSTRASLVQVAVLGAEFLFLLLLRQGSWATGALMAIVLYVAAAMGASTAFSARVINPRTNSGGKRVESRIVPLLIVVGAWIMGTAAAYLLSRP